VKRLGVLALIAIAAASLAASRSSAATSSSLATSISTVLSSNATDLNSLFNGVTLTATSVSVTSSLGTLSILSPTSPDATVKRVDVVVLSGTRIPVIIRLDPYRPTPPSSHPIPEARSVLLYALGFLGIGWMVLRSRKANSPHVA
jgi:hypothetical protein